MQFLSILSLLAATALASPVAVPDKNVTISIPHITTTTLNIPQTTFTASIGSFVETFTVPALPTGLSEKVLKSGHPEPPFATGYPGHHHHHNGSEPVGSHNGTEGHAKSTHWRFAKNNAE